MKYFILSFSWLLIIAAILRLPTASDAAKSIEEFRSMQDISLNMLVLGFLGICTFLLMSTRDYNKQHPILKARDQYKPSL
jgi:L-asparagine transporter-like permease